MLTITDPTASPLTVLDLVATGPALKPSPPPQTVLLLLLLVDPAGISLLRPSTRTHTAILLLVVDTLLLLHEGAARDNTVMENTLPAQPIPALSVSFSVLVTTMLLSNRLVSTLRNMMISQSRLPVKMSQSLFSLSPTHLWTTTCLATSSWPTTLYQHLFRSTRSQSSWAVVI